jgi:hypothetical protein
VGWQPDYTTLARLKDYLRIPSTDVADDMELSAWITAASRAADDWTNRQFGLMAAPSARTFRRTPYYDATTGMWWVQVPDVQTTVGALVNGVAYASSGWVLGPDNAADENLPWTRIGTPSMPYPSYPGTPLSNVFTMRWGWTTVPPQVETAVWLQVARWNQRRDAPAGVVGSPGGGSELRFLARMDPDFQTSLSGLQRRRRVS